MSFARVQTRLEQEKRRARLLGLLEQMTFLNQSNQVNIIIGFDCSFYSLSSVIFQCLFPLNSHMLKSVFQRVGLLNRQLGEQIVQAVLSIFSVLLSSFKVALIRNSKTLFEREYVMNLLAFVQHSSSSTRWPMISWAPSFWRLLI